MGFWAFIMLVIVICGLVIDLYFNSRVLDPSVRLLLQDVLLLLFALGVLIRIRTKTREGEKERLEAASRMVSRAEKRQTKEPWAQR